MNKMTAIDNYAVTYDVTKVQAKAELERVFDFIMDTLADGETLEIQGFGSFGVKHKEACVKYNPQDTTQKINVPAKDVPYFKPGATLKKAVNN